MQFGNTFLVGILIAIALQKTNHGIAEAGTESTEEQGRKHLHGHGTVYIQGANELIQQLQYEDTEQVAKNTIVEIHDKTTSTHLLESEKLPLAVLPHKPDCDLTKLPHFPSL